MPTAIEFENVHKTYGRRSRKQTALDDVSFRVETGEFVLLKGHSGAGKTTMIRLLLALEEPDSGVIRIADRDLHRLTKASIPYLRRNVGVVFQDFRLLADATPLENVRISLQILGLRRREVRQKAQLALERVGLDPNRKDAVRCLSGGEQQRVALARALASEPPILLADEPTGNLDPERICEILKLLGEIQEQGTTIMLATHDPQVLEALPDSRTLHLRQGKMTDPSATTTAGLHLCKLEPVSEQAKGSANTIGVA